MKNPYSVFFGFKREPFSQDLRVEEMLQSQAVAGAKERFLYAVDIGAIAVIIPKAFGTAASPLP